jgi:hypothetical protein
MAERPNLTAYQHQQLVLMMKGRVGWEKFLGLDQDRKEAHRLWAEMKLLPPVHYARQLGRESVTAMLAEHGSWEALAKYLAVSVSFLTGLYKRSLGDEELNLSSDAAIEMLETTKNIDLAARLLRTTPTKLRNLLEKEGFDLYTLTDMSWSTFSSGKGRKAENEFQARYPEATSQNKAAGPTAAFDFTHPEMGRVNVKSSRRWRYRATTRKGNPEFWKISLSGIKECDTIYALLYDERYESIIGHAVIPAVPAVPGRSLGLKTLTITRESSSFVTEMPL